MVETHEDECISTVDNGFGKHMIDLTHLEDQLNSYSDSCQRPRTVQELKSCIRLLNRELEDALNDDVGDSVFEGNTKTRIDQFEPMQENSGNHSLYERSGRQAKPTNINGNLSPSRENLHNINNAKNVNINHFSYNYFNEQPDDNGNMFRRENSISPVTD